MTKERRLGRGLAALLGSPTGDDDILPPVQPSHAGTQYTGAMAAENLAPEPNGLKQLNVFEIDDNPFQPRREFNEEEIEELAASLKAHDMLQPILVRKLGHRYQLISGERRLRAAILAGWKTVPVSVREADDRTVAELAIVENLQRKDLNAIEKALCFKRYLEEHRCTQDDLAKRLSIDRSHIANLVRLLELPAPVVEALRVGAISTGHAKVLLSLEQESHQITLAKQIAAEGTSVRELEKTVQMLLAQSDDNKSLDDLPEVEEESVSTKPAKKRNPRSEQLGALEQEFRRALGCKVEIIARSHAAGRVVIHYKTPADFQRLREQFSGVSSHSELD